MVNFQTDAMARETEQEGFSPDNTNGEASVDSRNGRPEILAIVQARGGSKGIPGKNIRDFGAHPLIAYSIASATASSTVTRFIVSTDDAGSLKSLRGTVQKCRLPVRLSWQQTIPKIFRFLSMLFLGSKRMKVTFHKWLFNFDPHHHYVRKV